MVKTSVWLHANVPLDREGNPCGIDEAKTAIFTLRDTETDAAICYHKRLPVAEGVRYYKPELSHGECEERLKEIPEGSIKLIVDDPPYGMTNEPWDTEPDWDKLTELYSRVLSDDGALVVFGKQPSLIPVYNAFTNDGFEFRFEWIWRKKTSPWVSGEQPIPIHENIFTFSKKGSVVEDVVPNMELLSRNYTFICGDCGEPQAPKPYKTSRGNGQKSTTQGEWQETYEGKGGDKTRYPISVLEYDGVKSWHPEYLGYAGQKPTDLLRQIITAMSSKGDTVLDPHAGSASTLVSCIPLCRRSIGIEKSAERYGVGSAEIGEAIDALESLKRAEVVNDGGTS